MIEYSAGIDIGGTFTDIVLQDKSGAHRHIFKILTTTEDPARAVIDGLGKLLKQTEIAPEQITRVVHATTLFTNALIERRGIKTGLLTTQGFGDLLAIGRERKYDLYDLFQKKPEPLVPGERCIEIAERMSAKGEVVEAIDMEAATAEIDRLVADGVGAIAVMFLHSFVNNAHEAAVADYIRKTHPGVFVSASFEVSPLIREYERLSTTVANAYIGPLAQTYLDDIITRLEAMGVGAPFFVMSSSGGVNAVADAKKVPVQLLESGPAAGALAGAYFGGNEGAERILAFDMGGTTAKVCIIDEGEPIIAHSFEAAREKRFADGSGLPISISTVELIEIGAGGGSIARIDAMGLLKVGPRSASSMPGPVCYGRGGTEPTVTDANLVNGILNPDYFLGGTMNIDAKAAGAELERIGAPVNLTPMAAASGIIEIVTESMSSAARVHAAERGHDVRDCVLLATGGAGPLHAFAIARKLGVKTMICPPSAGVGSAVGLLIAPARADLSRTFTARLGTLDLAALAAVYAELQAEGRRIVADAGGDAARTEVRWLADMRYVGQGSELTVGLPAGISDPSAIRSAFETAYERSFARTIANSEVEIVNLRIAVLAPTSDGAADNAATGPHDAKTGTEVKNRRAVILEGETFDVPVYDRYGLPYETAIDGPAILEEAETTINIGRNASFVRRPNGNIVVTLH